LGVKKLSGKKRGGNVKTGLGNELGKTKENLIVISETKGLIKKKQTKPRRREMEKKRTKSILRGKGDPMENRKRKNGKTQKG